jgi:hypothetical protein
MRKKGPPPLAESWRLVINPPPQLLQWRFALDQNDTLDLIATKVLNCAADANHDFGSGHGLHIPAQDGTVSKFDSIVSGGPEFVAYAAAGDIVGSDFQWKGA